MQRQYKFNLSKVHLSWFSDNPDVALGVENELRLIRMRRKNPDVTISLIYGASLLNPDAVTSLKHFCARHNIKLVDFDTEIMPLLNDEQDIKMYQFARKEMMFMQRKAGGNFVGTSDCLRLIVPVIEQFGIYKDFDVECQITTLDTVGGAPMILNAEAEVDQNGAFVMYLNSDMLAFAHDANNPEKLDDDAVRTIRELQKRVINNYEGKLTVNKLFHKDEMLVEAGQRFGMLFQHFYETKLPKSVFGFRQFLLTFDFYGAKGEMLSSLQHNYYNMACQRISGPSIFWSLYMFKRPTSDDRFVYGSVPCLPAYEDFILTVAASRVVANPVFNKAFTLTNTKSCQEQFTAINHESPAPGILADLSWTPSGKQNKNEREAEILRATLVAQRFFRRHRVAKDEVAENKMVVKFK